MKIMMKTAAAAVALMVVPGAAQASTTNGYGVGTSAVTGQYLDNYGGVATSVSAYRMNGDSSGNYTVMSDVAPVSFDNCAATNANSPGACLASHGGTTSQGFNQTFSTSNSGLNYNGGLAGTSTYANLATGTLGANGSTGYYQNAQTVARFVDTLNFNVAGASASTTTNITVKFQLDGGLFAPDAPVGTPSLGTRTASINDTFGFGAANGAVSFNLVGANANYGSSAVLTPSTNQNGWVSFTWDTISPSLTQFTGVYALSGISQSLGISNSLRGEAFSIGSFTYGNTSSLSFVLPSNVTFTSASGTFLSALTPPTNGAVPEPATWLSMIAGFSAVGFTLRSQNSRNGNKEGARVKFA
jgi:hypothetical protein